MNKFEKVSFEQYAKSIGRGVDLLSISTPIKFTRCVEYFHAMCSSEIPIDKAKVFLNNYAKYGIDMYKCYIY